MTADQDREDSKKMVQRWEDGIAQNSYDTLMSKSVIKAQNDFANELAPVHKEMGEKLNSGEISQGEFNNWQAEQRDNYQEFMNEAAEAAERTHSTLFLMDEKGERKARGVGGKGWEQAKWNKAVGWGQLGSLAYFGGGVRWPNFLRGAAVLGSYEALRHKGEDIPLVGSQLSIEGRRDRLKHLIRSGKYKAPKGSTDGIGKGKFDVIPTVLGNWWEGTKEGYTSVDAASVAYEMMVSGDDPEKASEALADIDAKMLQAMEAPFVAGGIARGVGHWTADGVLWALAGRLASIKNVGVRVEQTLWPVKGAHYRSLATKAAVKPGMPKLEKWARDYLRHSGDNLVTFNAVNLMKGDLDHLGHSTRDAFLFSLFHPVNAYASKKIGKVGKFGVGLAEGASAAFFDPVMYSASNSLFGTDYDVYWPNSAEIGASAMEFAFGRFLMTPDFARRWNDWSSSIERARKTATRSPYFRNLDIGFKFMGDMALGEVGSQSTHPELAGEKRAAVNYNKVIANTIPIDKETKSYPSAKDARKVTPQDEMGDLLAELEKIEKEPPKKGKIRHSYAQAQLQALGTRIAWMIRGGHFGQNEGVSFGEEKMLTLLKTIDRAVGTGPEGAQFALDTNSAQMLIKLGHEYMDGFGVGREQYIGWRKSYHEKMLEQKSVYDQWAKDQEEIDALKEKEAILGMEETSDTVGELGRPDPGAEQGREEERTQGDTRDYTPPKGREGAGEGESRSPDVIEESKAPDASDPRVDDIARLAGDVRDAVGADPRAEGDPRPDVDQRPVDEDPRLEEATHLGEGVFGVPHDPSKEGERPPGEEQGVPAEEVAPSPWRDVDPRATEAASKGNEALGKWMLEATPAEFREYREKLLAQTPEAKREELKAALDKVQKTRDEAQEAKDKEEGDRGVEPTPAPTPPPAPAPPKPKVEAQTNEAGDPTGFKWTTADGKSGVVDVREGDTAAAYERADLLSRGKDAPAEAEAAEAGPKPTEIDPNKKPDEWVKDIEKAEVDERELDEKVIEAIAKVYEVDPEKAQEIQLAIINRINQIDNALEQGSRDQVPTLKLGSSVRGKKQTEVTLDNIDKLNFSRFGSQGLETTTRLASISNNAINGKLFITYDGKRYYIAKVKKEGSLPYWAIFSIRIKDGHVKAERNISKEHKRHDAMRAHLRTLLQAEQRRIEGLISLPDKYLLTNALTKLSHVYKRIAGLQRIFERPPGSEELDANQERDKVDPFIRDLGQLANYLMTGGMDVLTVASHIASIEEALALAKRNVPIGTVINTLTGVLDGIKNITNNPFTNWAGQKVVSNDGKYTYIYLGNTNQIARRLYITEVNKVIYNTGLHESALIAHHSVPVSMHIGRHPTTGNELEGSGYNSYFSRFQDSFGRLVGFVGKRQVGKGKDADWIDTEMTFYEFMVDPENNLSQEQREGFAKERFLSLFMANGEIKRDADGNIISQRRLTAEEIKDESSPAWKMAKKLGRRAIAAVIGADASSPVVVHMSKETAQLTKEQIVVKIEELRKIAPGLVTQIEKDVKRLGLDPRNAKHKPYIEWYNVPTQCSNN